MRGARRAGRSKSLELSGHAHHDYVVVAWCQSAWVPRPNRERSCGASGRQTRRQVSRTENAGRHLCICEGRTPGPGWDVGRGERVEVREQVKEELGIRPAGSKCNIVERVQRCRRMCAGENADPRPVLLQEVDTVGPRICPRYVARAASSARNPRRTPARERGEVLWRQSSTATRRSR